MKKIKLRIISKETGEYEEGLIDAKLWAELEAAKKRTRLSWSDYIGKLLEDYKKIKKP